MKIVFKKHFPFGKFVAINLFGRLFIKDKDYRIRKIMTVRPTLYFKLIQHERSHTKQQNDLWSIGFYIWYVIEWFFKLFTEGKAYRELSFEREARANEEYTDLYTVIVHYEFDESFTICDKSLLNFHNIEVVKFMGIDKINYIEYIPTNFKGTLINCKWGSWLKYVFRKKP